MLWLYFCALLVVNDHADVGPYYKGMTISCRGWGHEWAGAGFAEECGRLREMGVSAVAIHPYVAINGEGELRGYPFNGEPAPNYVVGPIAAARDSGLRVMIKPHIAYWRSPFSWRGEIDFTDPSLRNRFFQQYRQWIVAAAAHAKEADLFVIGTELKKLTGYEEEWRRIIREVRAVTNAKLTYAANWDNVEQVRFWDALDYIGVQGYFPLSKEEEPGEAAIRAGWRAVHKQLGKLHKQYDKPIIFTEMGYNRTLKAASEPWTYQQDSNPEAQRLQQLCLKIGLEELQKKDWYRGVFLWKWFVGSAPYENFYLDEPTLIQIINQGWRAETR